MYTCFKIVSTPKETCSRACIYTLLPCAWISYSPSFVFVSDFVIQLVTESRLLIFHLFCWIFFSFANTSSSSIAKGVVIAPAFDLDIPFALQSKFFVFHFPHCYLGSHKSRYCHHTNIQGTLMCLVKEQTYGKKFPKIIFVLSPLYFYLYIHIM